MSIAALAHDVYTSVSTPIKTERSTEYQVFAKVTHQLKSSSTSSFEGFKNMAKAIQTNRKLWTILASDVAEADNGLPQSLRAQIFYLAEFTETHSQKVLAGTGSIDALVDINTAVMRGLRNDLEVVQ